MFERIWVAVAASGWVDVPIIDSCSVPSWFAQLYQLVDPEAGVVSGLRGNLVSSEL